MRMPPPPQPDWAYFLDLDGTLLDIAARPDAVVTDRQLLVLIERLFNVCGGALALVSGRTLADMEQRLMGLEIPLAGQHGLERRNALGDIHRRDGAASEGLLRMRLLLTPLVDRHPGLLLEDKGLSLALHYRQAPLLAPYLHRLLPRLTAQAGGGLMVQKGKRVLEVKPSGIDKGTAIEDFLREPPYCGRLPVFVGDDVTDEHGFVVVNHYSGISIKVGRGPSCARYRLPDVEAVRRWLMRVTGAWL